MSLTLYNIAFTSVPILIYGLFEQNLPDLQLLNEPRLYQQNAGNRLLQVDIVCLWLSEGVFHSLLTFFAFYFLDSLQLFSFGTAVFASAVILVNLRLLLQAKFWNVIFVTVVFLSILVYFGLT